MYPMACCCSVCVPPSAFEAFPVQIVIHSLNILDASTRSSASLPAPATPAVAGVAKGALGFAAAPTTGAPGAAACAGNAAVTVVGTPTGAGFAAALATGSAASVAAAVFSAWVALAISANISSVLFRSFWVMSCSSTRHLWTIDPANSTTWRVSGLLGCLRCSVRWRSRSCILIKRNRIKFTAMYLCCQRFSWLRNSLVSS
mmetsp:Transcript_10767/g.19151  ORF Transcript_10767/g.19151 Transcript_10767/m.19151 type:complete len:201 (-) Transcript_10767:4956-5558(-)